jgi:hypothetical protein
MTQEVAVSQTARAPVDDGAFKRTIQLTTRGHQYLKFVDGRLTADGIPEPAGTEYLVPRMEQVGRMFHKNGGPPETCEPDQIDELNSRIPESDWPIGLDDNPEPPFKVFEDIYLVDLRTGASFIFSNCTMGIKIAAEKTSFPSAEHAQDPRRERVAGRYHFERADEDSPRPKGSPSV